MIVSAKSEALMSYQDKERERLARLRDRQLSARNPRKSDDCLMKKVARRGRRSGYRLSRLLWFCHGPRF